MTPDCPYFNDGACEVASQLAGREVMIRDYRACDVCMIDDKPMAPNRVTASLAISTAGSKEEQEQLHKKLKRHIPPTESIGVGSFLSRMVKTLGFTPEEGCQCLEHAAEMNKRGRKWCEENVDTIAGWLEEEAERREFSHLIAHIGSVPLVWTAIFRARRAEAKRAKYVAKQKHRINRITKKRLARNAST